MKPARKSEGAQRLAKSSRKSDHEDPGVGNKQSRRGAQETLGNAAKSEDRRAGPLAQGKLKPQFAAKNEPKKSQLQQQTQQSIQVDTTSPEVAKEKFDESIEPLVSVPPKDPQKDTLATSSKFDTKLSDSEAIVPKPDKNIIQNESQVQVSQQQFQLKKNLRKGSFFQANNSRLQNILNAKNMQELEKIEKFEQKYVVKSNVQRLNRSYQELDEEANYTPTSIRQNETGGGATSFMENKRSISDYFERTKTNSMQDSRKKFSLQKESLYEIEKGPIIIPDMEKPRKKYKNQEKSKFALNQNLDMKEDDIMTSSFQNLPGTIQVQQDKYRFMQKDKPNQQSARKLDRLKQRSEQVINEELENHYESLNQDYQALFFGSSMVHSEEFKQLFSNQYNYDDSTFQKMKDKLTSAQFQVFKEVGAQIKDRFEDIKLKQKKIFLKFEKWPSLEALRTMFDSQRNGRKDIDFTISSSDQPNFKSIMQKQLIHKLIKPEDIFPKNTPASFQEVISRFIDLSAKSYQIKPRLDLQNIEIIYTKRYFLPVVFKRFYTIQIERYTKSVQQQFDELQKQNMFFNKNIDIMFKNAHTEILDYEDPKYTQEIKHTLSQRKHFAEKIQQEMAQKFYRMRKVISEMKTKDYQNIYEYKVHLYVYDLAAIDLERNSGPSCNEPNRKGKVQEELRRAADGMDNLVIEPVSSFELAQFYSLENRNMGLMFYKNLVDSALVNEEQGAIYFFMKDSHNAICPVTGYKLQRFSLRKLAYNQVQITKEMEEGVSDNHVAQTDLEELRNLKHQVLNYGQNKPKKEDRKYYENFYIEFPERDIMNNCKIFCLPQQLSKFLSSEDQQQLYSSVQRRTNYAERDLLESQIVVIAKFLNPIEIIFEFRSLKNYQRLFEKRQTYQNSFDQFGHGFENIKAFCDIKMVDDALSVESSNEKLGTVQISINVIDKQMINHYQLSFLKSKADLSLQFVDQKHLISYRNLLQALEFSGQVIFDNDRYETYLISKGEQNSNYVDITQDIRQKFTIQKLLTVESFDELRRNRARSNQSSQQIFLDHNQMMVDVTKKVEIGSDYQEKLKQAPPAKTVQQIEDMCEKNRLRKKFPQIDKSILQHALTKWLSKQTFFRAPALQKTSKSQELDRNNNKGESKQPDESAEAKIYVNSIEMSQNIDYILVNVHVVEYVQEKAFCSHLNKDILISILDLRSPTENNNPGFFSQNNKNLKIQSKTKSKSQESRRSLESYGNLDQDQPEFEKKKALQVQQIISMHDKFQVREVDEFDIYQEDRISEENLDQRILKYLKKTVFDVFEFVNNIQLLQFYESYQQKQIKMDQQRLITHNDKDFSLFEKQISIKNMNALFLADEKYLVMVKQTLVSKYKRQVIVDIFYNSLECNDDMNEQPWFHVVPFSDQQEFYAQLKEHENAKGLPDSRFNTDVELIYGLFPDADFYSIKFSDQLYQQNNIYVAKIDHRKEIMNVYISQKTVLEMFKMSEPGHFKCQMQLFQSIGLKGISRDVLDVQIICQQRGKFLVLFFKNGVIDFYEYMQNEIEEEQQLFLIQSCRISIGQMKQTSFQSERSPDLKIIKYSKMLFLQDLSYVADVLEQVGQHRQLFLYILMADPNGKAASKSDKVNLRYFEVKLDIDQLTSNFSIAARGSRIMNYVLSHENRFGIMYGSVDEPIHIQHNDLTQEIEVILSVRFSVIDFTKEIILNKAQHIFNKLNYLQHLNNTQTKNQFFTEREKKLISFQMHQVMSTMRKNIIFDQVVHYLIEGQLESSQKVSPLTLLQKSQRQEFLFGSLPHSINLNDSNKVRLMLEETEKLPLKDQKAIMNSIVNMKDLNQISLFQKCLEQGHNLSFKVIFDQLMKIHGGIRTTDDQFAIKCLQRQLNEMTPFLLMNHEIFSFIINQRQFQFQILARKLETEKTKVWLYEEQLAKYPNYELPELQELGIKDLKNWRKGSKTIEVMPEDYQTIFETLRHKITKNRSKLQKCLATCKNRKCFKNCVDQSDSDDASESKSFPDSTSIYLCLDFNVVGYGYKMMHKIYEAQEYKNYQPQYELLVERRELDKIKKQKRAEQIKKCVDCIKSVRQESAKERKLRLMMEREEMERKRIEAEQENSSQESEEEIDLSDWKPKSEIDEIAIRIPPYIEQFSEKKVLDLLVYQIQDILVSCEDQIHQNEKRFNMTTKLAFSKDIEGFVHHMWNQHACIPQRIVQFINLGAFIIPFYCDGYFFNKYLLVYPQATRTKRESGYLEDFNVGFTITGLVVQYFFLFLELIKSLASKRSKYQSLLKGPLSKKSNNKMAKVNVSFFNILVAVLYITWGYSVNQMQNHVKKYEADLTSGKFTAEEMKSRASTLNLRTQVLQYVHFSIMVLCFIMILELVQSLSFNLFKQIQILKKNFLAFSKYSLFYVLFNLLIGISFIWTNEHTKTIKEWQESLNSGLDAGASATEADQPAISVYRQWDNYGELQKIVKIFTGSLIHENLLSFQENPDVFLTHSWLQQIMDTVIYIFTIVFLLSIAATCYQIQTGVTKREACHDEFDYAYLLKKNSQNLEFQEVSNMGQDARAALQRWQKDPKSCWSWYREQQRKLRKFKQELGFEMTKFVAEHDTQKGKMLIIGYKI